MSNQEPSANQIKRSFVHPTQISRHLYCCVCAEVFNDPVRSKCLHTFCRSCIESWCANRRGAASCPVCRKPIVQRDLGKDLLAFQIINDLEIYCSNRGCPWSGPLSAVQAHLTSQCSFRGDKLPSWYLDYLRSQEEEFERKELEEEALDPNLRELMNKNKDVPLAMRLFKPGDQATNESLRLLLGPSAGAGGAQGTQ